MTSTFHFHGIPLWLRGSACNMGDPGSIPGSGRSPGEGNGNPLQYSCLENSMDGEDWWAIFHGVAKSWTRLSNFTCFHFHCILHCSQCGPVSGIKNTWNSFIKCRFLNSPPLSHKYLDTPQMEYKNLHFNKLPIGYHVYCSNTFIRGFHF